MSGGDFDAVLVYGDDEADLERVAWYAGNSLASRGRWGLPANAYGLHDMHGNVFEWCFDRLGRYPEGMRIDPRGPEAGEERVIRGGSAWNDAGFARVTYRIWRAPGARFPSLGFRVVRSLDEE
ncbi:MAG: SUMF1/EgtB/PvdO family nonheme iron enzyme [bacterium]